MSQILSVIETDTGTGTGSYPGQYLDSYSWSPEWIHGPYTVAGNSVSVTHTPDKLVFPLQFVKHLDPSGAVITVPGVDAMEDLPGPASAPHVVHMQEDYRDGRIFTLTVYSHDLTTVTDGEGNSYTYRTDYVTSFTVQIIANYTTNRDLLLAAVAARS